MSSSKSVHALVYLAPYLHLILVIISHICIYGYLGSPENGNKELKSEFHKDPGGHNIITTKILEFTVAGLIVVLPMLFDFAVDVSMTLYNSFTMSNAECDKKRTLDPYFRIQLSHILLLISLAEPMIVALSFNYCVQFSLYLFAAQQTCITSIIIMGIYSMSCVRDKESSQILRCLFCSVCVTVGQVIIFFTSISHGDPVLTRNIYIIAVSISFFWIPIYFWRLIVWLLEVCREIKRYGILYNENCSIEYPRLGYTLVSVIGIFNYCSRLNFKNVDKLHHSNGDDVITGILISIFFAVTFQLISARFSKLQLSRFLVCFINLLFLFIFKYNFSFLYFLIHLLFYCFIEYN